jgi:hypothetical protein
MDIARKLYFNILLSAEKLIIKQSPAIEEARDALWVLVQTINVGFLF